MSMDRLIISFVLVAIVVMKSIHPTLSQGSHCSKVYFREHISNITFYRDTLDSLPETAKLSVKYNITVEQEPCCPIISFGVNPNETESQQHLIKQCFNPDISLHLLENQYFIYLIHGNPSSGCTKNGTFYNCQGMRKFDVGKKVQWYLEVGHICGVGPTQDVLIEMEFECDYHSTCEGITDLYCKNELNYNQTSFPNALGQTSQQRGSDLMEFFAVAIQEEFSCYQHSQELICYSLFPRCREKKRIIPCRQTCEDFEIACQDVLQKYKQQTYCRMFPDTLDQEVCFYQNISCPMPKHPSFGMVMNNDTNLFSESEYVCDDGYEMKGSKSRFCTYNGHWNGTEPVCVRPQKTLILIVTISLAILVVVIAIVMALCIYNRKRIGELFTNSQFRMQRFN